MPLKQGQLLQKVAKCTLKNSRLLRKICGMKTESSSRIFLLYLCSMKFTFTRLVLLSITPLLFVGVVSAQTSDLQESPETESPVTETQEVTTKQQYDSPGFEEEPKTNIQQNSSEKKTALSERTQQRIRNLAANMSNRFDAIISRLQNIINRINSRIEKLEATGRNTTEARAALERAQSSLNEAKRLMENIDSEVSTVTGSPEPRTAWPTLKNHFIQTREEIKITHTELKNAVTLLRNSPEAATGELEN